MNFYSKSFPKKGDLVYCKIVEVNDAVAILELLEYKDVRGMMVASEASRKLPKAMSRLFSVGQKKVTEVINTDIEKRYVDLSKKNISNEEQNECEEKYYKQSHFIGILRRLNQIYSNSNSEDDEYNEKEEKEIVSNSKLESLLKDWGYKLNYNDLSEMNKDKKNKGWDIVPIEYKEKLETLLQHKFKSSIKTVRTIFELSCFSPNGIDDIKTIFAEVKSLDDKIVAKVISCPKYVIYMDIYNEKTGLELLHSALTLIQTKINSMNLYWKKVLKTELISEINYYCLEIKEEPKVLNDDNNIEQTIKNNLEHMNDNSNRVKFEDDSDNSTSMDEDDNDVEDNDE
jgi:translation initiation factor 2 alpha subunit (eIF-2alpha)